MFVWSKQPQFHSIQIPQQRPNADLQQQSSIFNPSPDFQRVNSVGSPRGEGYERLGSLASGEFKQGWQEQSPTSPVRNRVTARDRMRSRRDREDRQRALQERSQTGQLRRRPVDVVRRGSRCADSAVWRRCGVRGGGWIQYSVVI